jgi:hypothetical protein
MTWAETTALIKAIPAAWRHGGSKLLFAGAAACLAAFVVLYATRERVPLANEWWQSYSLGVLLAGVVFFVFACFKFFYERQESPKLILIADERDSSWDHAKQPNTGKFITHFSLRFDATNTQRKALKLSHAKLNRPWVWRRYVLDERVSTELPALNPPNNFGPYAIPSGTHRQCVARLVVKGAVGGEGRKKPMFVSISVQDNFNRWHKIKFRDLYSPAQRSARWT